MLSSESSFFGHVEFFKAMKTSDQNTIPDSIQKKQQKQKKKKKKKNIKKETTPLKTKTIQASNFYTKQEMCL